MRKHLELASCSGLLRSEEELEEDLVLHKSCTSMRVGIQTLTTTQEARHVRPC